ncbi:UNVERIFIED_CONTAM: hypothetical protein Sradi_7223100 [Sesamum radiatum]|uniref:Uncharacterized protein n=1 Tax=Sesamum radiatum TaxID=300843 RepID=A0AAW2IPK3_SESRA
MPCSRIQMRQLPLKKWRVLFLVHSVWILNLGLQAEQTMPAQARTHLEGQERATQQAESRSLPHNKLP